MSKRVRAIFALIAVTIIWGFTFSWMKAALSSAAQLIPQNSALAITLFIAARFLVAALVMPVFARQCPDALKDRRILFDGMLLGAVLMVGFMLQMYGLKDIEPSVSAFLTSLYVVFTAIFIRLSGRSGIDKSSILGIIAVTFGAGFISGPPHLSFGVAELMTVLCAFVFALHILVTDKVAQRNPPLAVTWICFVWVTALSIAVLFWLIAMSDEVTTRDVWSVLTTPNFLHPVLYSGVLGTLVAISLMTVYQKDVPPIRAAIIYALEPIWATVIALVVGQIRVDVWLIVGGLSLLFGNLWVEIGPKVYRKNQSPPDE